VRAGDLVADLTLARLTSLGIGPGDAVRIDVPAAEVAVYAPRG
jgi:molybdate transport system ATP-binding protein